MTNLQKLLNGSKKLHISIIALITILAYSSILQNGFAWDDNVLLQWVQTRNTGNILNVFAGDVPSINEIYYRPLVSLFYFISYKMYGFNPLGYHIQSIIIHLAISILIYLIILKITLKKPVAFIASLIFAVHPANTEAVAFVTGSFAIIGVALALASFYLYIQIDDWKFLNKKYMISLIFALLAIFTYELALVLPILMIMHDLCFRKISRESFWIKIKFYLPYFAILTLYLILRLALKLAVKGSYLAGSFYHTMLTMSKAFLIYISLLFWPFSLTADHKISEGIQSIVYVGLDRQAVLSQSIFDFETIVSLLMVISLIFIALKYCKNHPAVAFSIGLFFIGLAPVSYILPQASIMQERYLYVSLIGFSFLAAYLYDLFNDKIRQNSVHHKKIISLLNFSITGILIIFIILTFSRNFDWRNDFVLWSETVKSSPESSLAHYNLGLAFNKMGNLNMAIQGYANAARINPNYAEARNNLGFHYMQLGRFKEAIEELEKAAETNPNLMYPHFNLGLIYDQLNQTDSASEEYRKALGIDP
ncbi:tetratricopeptide repeat protein, partial [Candidatus Woesearchaeota archaeon]|nr:tetratricopeptide repeat protein [Candidatus Woesearchaeota archaeon]